jgi:hypothetical protein
LSFALLIMLVTLMFAPVRADASAPSPREELPGSTPPASLDELDFESALDGGECGDEEEQPEELVHCGAEISVFEQPGLLAILRDSIEKMQPDQCLELLDDLYEREMCTAGGRECGDVLPMGLPPVPESISASSTSASAWFERIAVTPAVSRVAGPRASDDPMPRARAIAPPERPPRSLTHG